MYPDGPLFLEPARPGQVPALEATVHDEELAPLPQRFARLDERARRLAGLDDNRRSGKRRHQLVAFGEEESVGSEILRVIAHHRHLADQQMLAGDPLLQGGVRLGIDLAQRRPDHRDRTALRSQRCLMCGGVDALGETGHHGEIIFDEPARERGCTFTADFGRFASADDRDRGPVDKIPVALEVKQLDRINGVPQAMRIFPFAMDANVEALVGPFPQFGEDLAAKIARLSLWHKV